MANLHSNTASSISYTESSKLLTIKFRSKLRNLEELKNELLNLAAHAHDKGVKHVLIDNQQLKTPVGKEFQSWAHMNIELPLLNAGIEKVAFVLPKDKKAFISGSFLFSEHYEDIDLYIISNKRKQFHKDKIHYIFITNSDLSKPLFNSASKFCVSNFLIAANPIISRPNFNELVSSYQIAINEILDNESLKESREIIFQY